jgi:hypothetical protein
MEKITNAQLIARLRGTGKVYMPIVSAQDVVHLAVEKAMLIAYLRGLAPTDACQWAIYADYEHAVYLDVA